MMTKQSTQESEEFDDEVLALARVLWDYHLIPIPLESSDFILVLGSNDARVARAASEFFLRGHAPFVVMSGGLGKVTAATQRESEAKRFSRVAVELGVPLEQILLEEEATNTGDNFTKTRELLKAKGIQVQTGIFVTKPYMKRRALATAEKQWPEVKWYPAAPDISFDDYPDEIVTRRQMIELMVGDLQRIDVYPAKGFQVPQVIPDRVRDAYKKLIEKGFTRFVMHDQL